MNDISLYERIPALENNFTVKFRLYENRTSALIPHWHEHIELMYLLRGECDFLCGGSVYPAKSGDLLVVNGSQIHSFETKSPLTFFSILLFPSFFDDIDFSDVVLENLVGADGYVRECFDDIYAAYTGTEAMSDMMLKSHTYRLVAYLGRKYRLNSKDSPTPLDSARLSRLNTVLEYISTSYSEKITTRHLASMLYLSEAHFCRFFKSAVGKSATEYINQYRIEKAAVLLSNTSEPIGTVGEQVGFEDINYFSRVFKREKGVTPGKYRKSHSSK